MPRIYGTVDILNFDDKGYTKAVREAMEVQFRQAARAFVRAAIVRIPVQTGMAKGAFLNIGRYLRVAVPISPTRFFQKYKLPGGGYIPKNAESGALLTTQPENMITWKDTRLSFEIDSEIFHLTLQDLIGYNSPTSPWGAFLAGRVAFLEEMRNLKNRLPKIKSYTTRTTVSFGRGGGIKSTPVRLRKQEKTK